MLDFARGWAAGRNAWVRLPLLAWLAWVLLNHLRNPFYHSLFGPLNLGLHELGHLLLVPLGFSTGIAGGTILQLAAPLVALWMFRRQGDWFAIAVALCWLGTNLFDVATYAGDARAQQLLLFSLGGDPVHDWYHLLGAAGLLEHDRTLSATLRLTATTAMLAGLALGTLLIAGMLRPPPRPDATARTPPRSADRTAPRP